MYKEDYKFEIGKAVKLQDGKDVAIFSTGASVYHSLEAAKLLQENGISCSVINFHTIKPIDEKMIIEFINSYKKNDTCFIIAPHQIDLNKINKTKNLIKKETVLMSNLNKKSANGD